MARVYRAEKQLHGFIGQSAVGSGHNIVSLGTPHSVLIRDLLTATVAPLNPFKLLDGTASDLTSHNSLAVPKFGTYLQIFAVLSYDDTTIGTPTFTTAPVVRVFGIVPPVGSAEEATLSGQGNAAYWPSFLQSNPAGGLESTLPVPLGLDGHTPGSPEITLPTTFAVQAAMVSASGANRVVCITDPLSIFIEGCKELLATCSTAAVVDVAGVTEANVKCCLVGRLTS